MRFLARHKCYTGINILGLTISLCACLVIYNLVNYEFSFDRIKDYEGNTDFPYTDFISFSTIGHSFLKYKYRNDEWHFNPGIPGIQAFVKLSKNANPGQAAVLFDALLQRHIATDAFLRFLKYSLVLQPLGDIHFNEAYDNDGIRTASRPVLYGLLGIAVFILLLAVVNFINLSTAQVNTPAGQRYMSLILKDGFVHSHRSCHSYPSEAFDGVILQ
ncbi:MAG: hypothetical protein INR73_06125 [Williamsia sp.]|nr:hypothetical protein [Williamsia sp.]